LVADRYCAGNRRFFSHLAFLAILARISALLVQMAIGRLSSRAVENPSEDGIALGPVPSRRFNEMVKQLAPTSEDASPYDVPD